MQGIFTRAAATYSLVLLLSLILTGPLRAQIAANKCKFLGNVIGGSVPSGFDQYWNQVTPENSGKWGSVEGVRDNMIWNDLDEAYDHAKDKGYPFKQHTFIWESQKPGWIDGLSQEEQLAEIEEWISSYCDRFPDTDFIEVVNEPINAPASYNAALGGAGATGYDWVIKSYELARNHCPNAKLLINEYNILNGYTSYSTYLDIINLLKERDLIDGIGVQGHSLEDTPVSTITTALDALATADLPVYVTEYDVRGTDNEQLDIYKEQFPVMWSHEAVQGITLWGYIQGQMWRNEAYLLSTSGTSRPALSWLENYVKETIGGTFCDLVTGVGEELPGLKVYPNPAINGRFKVELMEGISGIRITDITGRTVDAISTGGRRSVEVELDSPPGIYILKVSSGHRTVTRKLAIR